MFLNIDKGIKMTLAFRTCKHFILSVDVCCLIKYSLSLKVHEVSMFWIVTGPYGTQFEN